METIKQPNDNLPQSSYPTHKEPPPKPKRLKNDIETDQIEANNENDLMRREPPPKPKRLHAVDWKPLHNEVDYVRSASKWEYDNNPYAHLQEHRSQEKKDRSRKPLRTVDATKHRKRLYKTTGNTFFFVTSQLGFLMELYTIMIFIYS